MRLNPGTQKTTYRKPERAAETGRVTYCRPLITCYHSGVGRGGKLPGTRPPPPACSLPLSACGACLGAAACLKLKCCLHSPSPASLSITEQGREGHPLKLDLTISPVYVFSLLRL